MFELYNTYVQRLGTVLKGISWESVHQLSLSLLKAWETRNAVYLCGNGGSAGNAIHLANDFIYGIDKRYLKILNGYQKKILERRNILKQYNYDENWNNINYHTWDEIVNHKFFTEDLEKSWSNSYDDEVMPKLKVCTKRCSKLNVELSPRIS